MLTHHGEGMCQQTEVHFQIRVCPHLGGRNRSRPGSQTTFCVCTQKDLVRHSEAGMACCRYCCSSVVQSCPTLCDPWDCSMPSLLSSSVIPFSSHLQSFPASESFVTLNILFEKKKKRFRHFRNISICSFFYYPENVFPSLTGENITIGLKSVTFYHHSVFAKARNNL